MGKKEKKNEGQDFKSNKTHKTLRQKLRKKREQLKRHKKQKSDHKKQYNIEQQKLKFFTQSNQKKQDNKQLKIKKINKYIQKFINIYQDDLQQFYDMFKTLDQKGSIDISQLENKLLYKCIKKLFKYLPIKKQKGQYRKVETSNICLERFIKNKVSQSIENYLENGSNPQESNQQSSIEQNEDKKQLKKQKLPKKIKQQDIQQAPKQIRLYKETLPVQNNTIGPSIPPQLRQLMAKNFQQQLIQLKKNKEAINQAEQDQFSKIFNSGKTRKQMKQYNVPKEAFDVPQHLLANGSALIGQKVEIDDNEIEEYNKIHRPKKLIDMHKQMKQTIVQEDPKKRKPFDRERDILGSGKMSLMSNSTFFDFKSRMSKPKQTNQFL